MSSAAVVIGALRVKASEEQMGGKPDLIFVCFRSAYDKTDLAIRPAVF